MTKKEIDSKIENIIEFSECRQFIDTPVKRYSSGMYVKLAFAVAAHLDSEIMIMDEVLAVGDTRFQQKCLNKMKEVSYSDNRTILYVSHNMNTIRNLCDRCIVLNHGKIEFDGDVDKGIGYYVGSISLTSQDMHYSESYHKHIFIHNDFSINDLHINNYKDEYYLNDKIDLILNCSSKKQYDNVNFRFEIKSAEENIIGTAFTSKGMDFSMNQNRKVNLILDLAHLTPGRYYVDIIAFLYAKDGGQVFIDGVYPGMIFDISEVGSEENYIQWRPTDWGNVRLHDVVCIGEKNE